MHPDNFRWNFKTGPLGFILNFRMHTYFTLFFPRPAKDDAIFWKGFGRALDRTRSSSNMPNMQQSYQAVDLTWECKEALPVPVPILVCEPMSIINQDLKPPITLDTKPWTKPVTIPSSFNWNHTHTNTYK
jgi:hypothetical protein